MGKVFLDMSMSLDGFITGPNSSHDQPLGDGGECLPQWMHRRARDVPLPNAASTGAVDRKIGLKATRAVDGSGVTHLVFRLKKGAP